MKSDNAPIHYKNLYGFKSMQNLPDKYNFRIIRIYEAAGHDKLMQCQVLLRRQF